MDGPLGGEAPRLLGGEAPGQATELFHTASETRFTSAVKLVSQSRGIGPAQMFSGSLTFSSGGGGKTALKEAEKNRQHDCINIFPPTRVPTACRLHMESA
jgi:hypothetical protein